MASRPTKRPIVLIQPKTGSWDYLGARLPESLLSVASVPVSKGYTVHILDQRIEANWETLLRSYLKENPLLVCITSMTGPQIRYALELTNLIKSISPQTTIMWGGLHPTMQPHQTLSEKNIDLLVVGEGDHTFIETIQALEQGRDLSKVKGIMYKDKQGKMHLTPARPMESECMDYLPDLPYHLVDVKKYYGADYRNKPSMTLLTSKGCPFRCNFCIDPAVFKQKWRWFSAKKVLQKMDYLMKTYGIKDFYFQDDNFATNLDRVKDICQGIVDKFDDVAWGTLGIRADTLRKMPDELIALMEKSGCRNIDTGLESGSQKMLDLMQKDESIEDYIEANRKMAKYNIIMKYTFVLGYPTETKDDLMQTKRLALQLMKENKRAYCAFFTFCPYLGTKSWDLSLQHGFKPPQTLIEWADFDFDGWYKHSPAWLSKRMQKMIENLNFTSYFQNKNIKYKISSRLGKFFFDLYYPVAKFRFVTNFYYFPIERKLQKLFLK
ncbi:MAG TPA: radical SAM protein [Candidatus Nanoarchaeia archaeon]|nr:radical SAM protein [Candidatus Nanoarchaeia archaeon]